MVCKDHAQIQPCPIHCYNSGMIQFSPIQPDTASDDLKAHFKHEIEQLEHQQLPLQKGLEHTSVVSYDEPFSAVILHIEEKPAATEVKAGIFFSGIIGGCNCADDPTPPSTLQEYCELLFVVDRASGEATVALLNS